MYRITPPPRNIHGLNFGVVAPILSKYCTYSTHLPFIKYEITQSVLRLKPILIKSEYV